jgi:hypothetical protein
MLLSTLLASLITKGKNNITTKHRDAKKSQIDCTRCIMLTYNLGKLSYSAQPLKKIFTVKGY